LGSSSCITNLDGEVVQHIEYVPFGEVFLEEKNSKWNTPYLFTSMELDKETGWNYFHARYQDPKLGIFLSVDPMAQKNPWFTPYNYVRNNPINRIDPDGRTDFEINGEKQHINDGNNDLTVRNVTQKQFDRLQKRFEGGKTPNYNRLLNKLTQKNGYQVYRIIKPSWVYSNETTVEIMSYGKNNKTPYYKYAHRSFYHFTQGIQDLGGNVSKVGLALTASVVGAEIGIPMAKIGGYISSVGLGLQSGMDLYTGNYEEIGTNAAFFIGGKILGAGANKFMDANMVGGKDSDLGKEVINQLIGTEVDLTQEMVKKQLEK
jgi:RHS repeat-associated protein